MDYCDIHSAHVERLDRDDVRLNDHSHRLDEQAKTLAEVSATLETATKLLEKMDGRMDAVEKRPANDFSAVKGYMAAAIISAVVSAASTNISLLFH